MADLSQSARNSVALQHEMFRLAKNDYGLSTSVLAKRAKLPKSTLDGWASGHTQMPAWALGELGLPDDLTSIILNPYGKHIGTDEPDDGDLATLGREAAGFVSEKLERMSDGKLCHIDQAALKGRARRIAAIARRVAA